MINCAFCGNKHIKNSFAEYTYKKDSHYLIVNNVPCYQCEYCGEKYYEAKVLKQIEEEFFLIQKGKLSPPQISIPVEEFSQLHTS